MKKWYYYILAFLLMCGVGFAQDPQPYVSRFVTWNIPTNNTDGSTIVDFNGINVYYSFDGPTNFVKGTDGSNFLVHIEGTTTLPSILEPSKLIQRKAFKWDGIFDNTNIWVKVTALDKHGNESEFSDAAVADVSNVNLTNDVQIIYFAIENRGIAIWLAESDGTEILEASRDLVKGNWTEIGPLHIWQNLRLGDPVSDRFFKVKRPIPLPPIAVAEANVTEGSVPLVVQFTGSNSSDPNEDVLTFLWAFGDSATSTNADVEHIYSSIGEFTVKLSVSDEDNVVDASPIIITVTNAIHPNLVAEYLFDEGQGTVAMDTSHNNNDGTINGAMWTATSHKGKALFFDGLDDIISIQDHSSLDLTNAMTIMAWVYPNVVDNRWRTVVLKGQARDLAYSLYSSSGPDGYPEGHIYASRSEQARGTSSMQINEWAYLATTFDGNVLKLYINGNLIGETYTNGDKIVITTNELSIGGNKVWFNESFSGVIDEVRIFNAALDINDIQSFMNK